MATLIPMDYSQPANTLTAIADNQRTVNQVKNDYVPKVDEYSVTNPDAMADGDAMGRGTGVFLDILDRKSTRLNSSHVSESRMPSSA